MKINAVGVAAAGAGAVLLVSSLHGWGLVPRLQGLLTGKKRNDKDLRNVNQLSSDPSGQLFGGGTQGYAGSYQSPSAIANAAMQFDGGPYGWGQSGPPGTPNDCSGMCNYA